MTTSVIGLIEWGLTLDKDGHRDYKAKVLCKTTDPDDGPQQMFNTSGLAAVGAAWGFGNDTDSWALKWPNEKWTPVLNHETNQYWIVEQLFTTRPLSRCQTASIEDPLDEPAKLSGSFTKFRKEATRDKDGNPILNSAKQQIKGAILQRDFNHPTVVVEMNVSSLPLSTFSGIVDTVNDATLWGLAAGRVKLSNVSWERKLYGTCTYYYTVRYEFDIQFGGFSVTLLDEGTMKLGPGGSKNNPKHMIVATDDQNRPRHVILDGNGSEWDGSGSPGYQTVEFYSESDMTTLNIPASL